MPKCFVHTCRGYKRSTFWSEKGMIWFNSVDLFVNIADFALEAIATVHANVRLQRSHV